MCTLESTQAAPRAAWQLRSLRFARPRSSLLLPPPPRPHPVKPGGAGTAYLSYTLERQLLFTEGVTLHVRPGDAARWRPFASLSGGQQALGALALSLALQVRGMGLPCSHQGMHLPLHAGVCVG